ncbi:uncharacterized protein LOC102711699 isoform X2 [Oryza brachyantha]|uniref:uncharacterized protein LOC102711699 isoform X2 n=1 Tax=Oryza brachyantha TaxID=4533 RepID=UPI0007767173|nr:uncharacterized protein LOC102711699 isoform X2 [Oryza brachyantha]
MGIAHKDYQEQPSKFNYVTDLGSHGYSKEARTLGRIYHRQQPYFSTSSCSYEKSSALKVVPSSPDASGSVVWEMRTKNNNLSARSNYLSYPTDFRHMRRYPDEAKVGLNPDDDSKQYRRSDRFTAFSNFNGQSSKHLQTAKGANYMDETTLISRQWCFDNRGSSPPRGLEYGNEIPSLSFKKCNGHVAPLYPSIWDCGAETSSLRQFNGDEIPSLSHHWHYQDKISLHSGQWCHDAEAHQLASYQQGASRGNARLREDISRGVRNKQGKFITSRHTMTKPRAANKVVSSTDHYRIIKDNPWRSSEDIRDQVRGPRANKLNDSTSSTKNSSMPPLVCRDQINRPEFTVQYEHAKFFMIKSYSEDDVHKCIKYNVWASTPNGNNKLDAAFHEAQILMKEQGKRCPIFLFFSVNTSGQFVGLAEMLGPVDFKKTMDFWQQDKWNGFFPVRWHIIKDIPNWVFREIFLENNEGKVVTFSRDTQEIGLPQGLDMLNIFKAYHQGTSILDDFYFYEEKENIRRAQKGRNLEQINQDWFSDDFRSISVENLEESMQSLSFYRTWD